MNRRRRILQAVAGLTAFPLLHSARAQSFPARPVQIVVPFPAGGTSDTLGRLVADALGKVWGQSVIVQNRPGATGVIGTKFVSRAAPDGYTLVFANDSSQITAGLITPPAQYDPVTDFSPISEVARGPFILARHAGLQAASVAEIVAYARANPGKLNFGSSGIGTTPHLIGEMFKLVAGIDIVHIPYPGAAQFTLALRSGEMQLGFLSSSESIAASETGQVRLVATPSPRRIARFPDVPTMTEAGLADVRDESSFGLLGPPAMERALVDRIHTDLVRALQQPAVKKRITDLEYSLVLGTPAEYAQALGDAAQRKRRVVTEARIKA